MAYKQRWLDYFELLDADHSGFIEPSDAAILGKSKALASGFAEGTPEHNNIVNAIKDQLADVIREFDANKDGKVSKEELLDAAEKKFVGKTVNELPAFLRANITTFFKSYDTNNNGELSLDEVVAMYKKVSPEVSEDTLKGVHAWVVKHSPTGKFDVDALLNVCFLWAASPDNIPEVNYIMDPFFKKKH